MRWQSSLNNPGNNYADFYLSDSLKEVKAGMTVIEAKAKGRYGVDLRIFLYAFSRDGLLYFGIWIASDKHPADGQGADADKIMNSIRCLKGPDKKQE